MNPALTPSEWKELERYGWEATVLRDGYPGGNNYRVSASVTTRGEMRVQKFGMHALAALALHGQPFGFSREDVAMLRECAKQQRDIEHDREASAYAGSLGYGDELESLAARIEALLQPEDK